MANARPDPTLAEFETGTPDFGCSSPLRLPDFNHTYPIMAGLFDQQPTRASAHADASSRHRGTRRGIFAVDVVVRAAEFLPSLCSLYAMYVCRGCILVCTCMDVHELCTSCSTAVSHTPYVCRSTTELMKSDSLHARRCNTAQNREVSSKCHPGTIEVLQVMM